MHGDDGRIDVQCGGMVRGLIYSSLGVGCLAFISFLPSFLLSNIFMRLMHDDAQHRQP